MSVFLPCRDIYLRVIHPQGVFNMLHRVNDEIPPFDLLVVVIHLECSINDDESNEAVQP